MNPSTICILSALEAGNKMELSLQLKKFKTNTGAVNFDAVLRIPHEDRLTGLISKVGYEKIHMTIGAAIQLSMESMNLAKPLTANQIFDLVDSIIDSANEDYFGIEDILLFLQKLVRGETGNLFSSIDIPKFMQMFEKYRQERHSEYMRIKEEMELQYKATPLMNERLSVGMRKNTDIDNKTFFELLETYQSGKSE